LTRCPDAGGAPGKGGGSFLSAMGFRTVKLTRKVGENRTEKKSGSDVNNTWAAAAWARGKIEKQTSGGDASVKNRGPAKFRGEGQGFWRDGGKKMSCGERMRKKESNLFKEGMERAYWPPKPQ